MVIINLENHQIKRWFYLFILFAFTFIILYKFSYIFDFIRTIKILIIRLGLPALIITVFFKKQSYIPELVKFFKIIIAISFINLFAVFIKENYTEIEHVDFYQLFDNFTFPLAHTLSIITISILFNVTWNKGWLKLVWIISITTLNLIFLNSIQNKNTTLNRENIRTISLLNDDNRKKKNLYVVSETFDRSKNPYFQNPYMSLGNSTLPWYVRNLNIVYANTLYPVRDATDSLYNRISRNNLNILNNKDSLSFYNVGNVIYQ
jgi:hypothetical protein